MKKYIVLFISFLVFILPNNVSALSYEMITYDINVKINENRIADIKEEYNIYFIDNLSSFKRFLNKKLVTIRPNGTKRITTSLISNIKVFLNDNPVEFTFDNNIITTLQQHKKDTVEKYTISYSYDYGKDTGVGLDEIFIELINGQIDTNISSISFTIELPHNIDASKVKFLYNSDWNNGEVDYSIEGNFIKGFLNRNLKSKEKLSLYMELPEGYFVGATDNYNYLIWLLILVPLSTIIVAIVYYKKYKKGNITKIILNDEIPYNFNSAEIAYLYKGFLKEHDLLTILISLANNGYLKFIESDDGYKLDSINSFLIEKLKEYDGENAAEKLLFEKLFQDKDLIELKDIEYNLYDTLLEAKSSIDNTDNHEKLFFNKIMKDKRILSILIIISILAMNFNSIYLYTSNYFLVPVIVALMTFGIYILFVVDTKWLIKLIFGVLLIGISLYIGIMPLINDIRTLCLYLLGMIIIFLSSYIYKILPYRTLYGNEVYGRIHGFKVTLEKMSISTMKEKLESNPNYFYEMYPYIYIFENTDVWIDKAKNLVTEYPSWYSTKEPFSLQNFQKFVKNMIFTVTQAMFKRQLTGQSKVHVEYHRTKTDEL